MTRVWIVDAVRLNAFGDVFRVIWGVADTETNKWVRPPDEADVIDVVDALLRGQEVATRKADGALGPRLRVIATKGAEGIQTVATIDRVVGVADLKQF